MSKNHFIFIELPVERWLKRKRLYVGCLRWQSLERTQQKLVLFNNILIVAGHIRLSLYAKKHINQHALQNEYALHC